MPSEDCVERISQALYETDPMNTSCKENDCIDEYDYVACAVEQRLVAGYSLKEALVVEISHWFFDGEGFVTDRLTPVIELLEEER